MKFKIDENLPVEIAEILKEKGYDATTTFDENINGEKDNIIALCCLNEERTLITLDTDFADIRTYPPEFYHGLIVMRLNRQDKPYILTIFNKIVELFSNEPLKSKLWIVDESRIRIRD